MTKSQWKILTKDAFPAHTAYLQAAVMSPGGLMSDATLSPDKVKGLKLFWTPHTLFVEARGTYNAIHMTNVKNVFFAADENEEKKAH